MFQPLYLLYMNDIELTREGFIKALDTRISNICGLGYEDLPDVVMIDDYYYEDMDKKEFIRAVKDCAATILEESGYNDFDE